MLYTKVQLWLRADSAQFDDTFDIDEYPDFQSEAEVAIENFATSTKSKYVSPNILYIPETEDIKDLSYELEDVFTCDVEFYARVLGVPLSDFCSEDYDYRDSSWSHRGSYSDDIVRFSIELDPVDTGVDISKL